VEFNTQVPVVRIQLCIYMSLGVCDRFLVIRVRSMIEFWLEMPRLHIVLLQHFFFELMDQLPQIASVHQLYLSSCRTEKPKRSHVSFEYVICKLSFVNLIYWRTHANLFADSGDTEFGHIWIFSIQLVEFSTFQTMNLWSPWD